MTNISVIIPTLQKNTDLLFNLIKNLEKDENVKEIIVIDNSLKGITCKCDKLKVITPKENLFVNPSWNLGVKEAKYEIVALLNDDIIIPKDFCSTVAHKMTPNIGAIGANVDFVETIREIIPAPNANNLVLSETEYRNPYWGIMIFFNKKNYKKIPEDMKIFYGDDWIFETNKKAGRKNYYISNVKIYHWGSLSVSTVNDCIYIKQDKKRYRHHTLKWYNRLFNFEKLFRGFRIIFLGIEFTYHTQKSFE
ncbi:MAG: glycosyltransferase [Candidatus Gastranaerophilales bacterium]|nr:glycosyltransferase [Candidatus Gastranaerophilales bacterium]